MVAADVPAAPMAQSQSASIRISQAAPLALKGVRFVGGGVGIARTGFCGPIGALNSCAEAALTNATAIAIRNIFIFFLSFEACKFLPVTTPCPHYTPQWTTLKRPDVFWI